MCVLCVRLQLLMLHCSSQVDRCNCFDPCIGSCIFSIACFLLRCGGLTGIGKSAMFVVGFSRAFCRGQPFCGLFLRVFSLMHDLAMLVSSLFCVTVDENGMTCALVLCHSCRQLVDPSLTIADLSMFAVRGEKAWFAK